MANFAHICPVWTVWAELERRSAYLDGPPLILTLPKVRRRSGWSRTLATSAARLIIGPAGTSVG